jgi:hypothetical protein
MRRIIDSIVRLWRERVRGPVLRTYDTAVEELGGPWKKLASTERWFLATPTPTPIGEGPPAALDSAAIKLTPPPLVGGRGRWVAAAVAIVAIILFILALAGGSAGAPAAALAPVMPPRPAAPPVPAPAAAVAAPAAPSKAPAAASKPSVSSQLQKLIGPSRARPHPRARRHH